nr:T9SS type A sorting domain-containing protein [Bacteroidota bacterium]
YTTRINTSAYNTGIYFIRTITDKGTSTSRLIVE